MCHHIAPYQMVHNVASHILRFPWLSAGYQSAVLAFNVATKFTVLVWWIVKTSHDSRNSHMLLHKKIKQTNTQNCNFLEDDLLLFSLGKLKCTWS